MEILRDDFLRCRVEGTVRREARIILSHLGLSEAAGINLFLNMVRIKRGLPFEAVLPPPKPGDKIPITLPKEDKAFLDRLFPDGG